MESERRAEHVVLRAAITQELWSRSGSRTVVVYRAAASEQPLRARDAATFASATLSREVAEAHFAGTESTAEAVIVRRRVALSDLLMTFLETEALNHPYREAEAVLIGWTALSF